MIMTTGQDTIDVGMDPTTIATIIVIGVIIRIIDIIETDIGVTKIWLATDFFMLMQLQIEASA